ncbi:Flp pilus assembly protein TadG [Rhodobacter viridis]|uniref:Flp pilus assembly protein TadG n=1 Tax=Rhodobacter viridis TaxID=1054202 RepID=A0A318U0V7_9RHOB|nr:VWA domain-containing protein [Rhodobacter viridis]PYF09652.1 Flp pilus assembly protein TadG [Rhodobacter viridis]
MKLSSRDGKDRNSGLLRRLVRNEDGALIILSLQIFILMLVCTGVAIDLVRVEERRAVIQNTLDRAALAAASLSQDLDPTFVVDDYLKKAGLDYLDIDPVVEEGNFHEWRRVTIVAKDKMPTIFKPFTGIDYLTANGNSQALEAIGNVEISLVLDVSGSMNDTVSSSTRIALLKTAAKNFVTSMFEKVQPASAPAGRLSISVVPYNQQVILGDKTSRAFTLSTDHTQNTCADLTTLPTNSLAVSPSTTLTRTMYGDSFDYWGQNALGQGTWNLNTNVTNLNCEERAATSVLAFATDKTTIMNKIEGLTAKGDTAIDMGARWGLALLDPAARPALNTLITNGDASNVIRGRPLDYDDGTKDIDETALKVLVLMTDGQNTRSYSTKADYRTGNSGFISMKNATAFSTDSNGYLTGDWDQLYYYLPAKGSAPYFRMRDSTWLSSLPAGTKYQITWPTIWSKNLTLQYVIKVFLTPPLKSYNAANTKEALYAQMAIQSEFAQKDSDLSALCTTAKNSSRGVIIFTVAVDAPTNGVNILRNCATADTYAYDVAGANVSDAFASIAEAINALRLTN